MLYALEPGGTVRIVLDGVTGSNGIAWPADGATMFYVDSGTQDVAGALFRLDVPVPGLPVPEFG